MKLGGIIYLHDISRPRMLGSVHQNLEVFQNLCGSKPLSSVVIGITKSGEISNALSEKRRKELSSRHWKEMIDAGVTVYEENNTSSARNMINRLLENAQPTSVTAVEIQSEIVGTLNLLRTWTRGNGSSLHWKRFWNFGRNWLKRKTTSKHKINTMRLSRTRCSDQSAANFFFASTSRYFRTGKTVFPFKWFLIFFRHVVFQLWAASYVNVAEPFCNCYSIGTLSWIFPFSHERYMSMNGPTGPNTCTTCLIFFACAWFGISMVILWSCAACVVPVLVPPR